MAEGAFLPAGFPWPEREVLAQLRANILALVKTQHPPEWEELAVSILADQAGLSLEGEAVATVWTMPPAERAPLFARLGELIAEASA